MCALYNDYLAKRIVDMFKATPPRAGQLFLARFPRSTTADLVADKLAATAATEKMTISVGMKNFELPCFIAANGVKCLIIRACSKPLKVDDPPHRVTSYFAAALRDYVSDSSRGDLGVAMLIISDLDLDTLKATEDLLKPEGCLHEGRIMDDLLDTSKYSKPQSRILIDSLSSHLRKSSFTEQNLEALIALNNALIDENAKDIPELIGRLPGFMREDLISDDFFQDNRDESTLSKAIKEQIDDNAKNFEIIEKATRKGRNLKSALQENYSEDFVERVLDGQDQWQNIGHAAARRSTTHRQAIGLKQIEVTSRHRFNSASSGETSSRSISLMISPDGTVKMDIQFLGVLDQFSYKLSGKKNAKPTVTKHDSSVECIFEDIPKSELLFSRIEIWTTTSIHKGKADKDIHIAFVPDWFFNATEGCALQVDASSSDLICLGGGSIMLSNPDQSCASETYEKAIVGDDGIVELTGPLEIQPEVKNGKENVRVHIGYRGSTPIPILFTMDGTEDNRDEVIFPLLLQAISTPKVWSDEQLRLVDGLTIDFNRGDIHLPSGQKLRLTDDITEMLNLEFLIAREDSILPRSVEGSELKGVELNRQYEQSLDPDLKGAYSVLFNHFRCRSTTPSTDNWDIETQRLSKDVVNAYLKAVEKISSFNIITTQHEILSTIGTINSRTLDRTWMTSYHPLMLAYALRLAEWRDVELCPQKMLDGFRRDYLLSRFNTAGLLPFRHFIRSDAVLTGMTMEFSRLWVVYSAVNRPGSTTPDFMSRVISDKLDAFRNAYRILFDLHSERTMVINLVNMGNLGPVIKGISNFFKKVQKEGEPAVPKILLRIYGPHSDGMELDSFYSDNAYSRLRTQMRKFDDETVDLLLSRLSYVRAGMYNGSLEPAHITFFRGVLEEKPGWGRPDKSGLKSGMFCQGLFPARAIDVGTEAKGSVYTVGFGSDETDQGLVVDAARAANALEASSKFRGFERDAFIKQTIESRHLSGDLSHIWKNSLWVIHVQPNVSLEFYLNVPGSEEVQDQRIIIHYSDQYDPSSPGYDVITSTIHREHYLAALRNAIAESRLSNVLDPEIVLKYLVSVDGELALKLQRSDRKNAVECMGFIGALGLSRELLGRGMPDYIWIPLSLSELVRQTRSGGSEGPGLLQYDSPGEACDDFCFVGCPRDSSSGELNIRLWIVEAKGGTSSVTKGKGQVWGAHEKIRELLSPSEMSADKTIVCGLFGRVVVDIARRMTHYEVLSKDDWDVIAAHSRELIEGIYKVDDLRTVGGQYGEVIQISTSTNMPEVEYDESVRVIKAPMKVIEVLKGRKLEEIVPDLNIGGLIRYEVITGPTVINGMHGVPSDDLQSTESEVNSVDQTSSSSVPKTEEVKTSQEVIDPISSGESINVASGEPEQAIAPALDLTPEKALNDVKWDFLEKGKGESVKVEIGPLLSDIKRGFDSLGVDIFTPSPSTVTISPRRVSVDVVPKEGERVEKVMKSLDTLSVSIRSKGKIQADLEPASGAIRLSIPTGEMGDIRIREALDNMGSSMMSSPLTIPLGIDTRNKHRSLSLPDERHVLIAGTTGSGKSNFLTTTIVSLALSMSPEDLKIGILDPKGVDFGRLADLPHVAGGGYIDNPTSCIEFLRNIVDDDLPKRQTMLRSSGFPNIYELRKDGANNIKDGMPFHVIVIDEYADLVMSLTKGRDDFEELVCRLAQIGRALGYIILLSTQRPSADIVSGKIKANFPCRIAFRLPSSRDSVVILDEAGAEDLAGSGDMIVKTQTSTMRLQAYRTSTQDVSSIINHLKNGDDLHS